MTVENSRTSLLLWLLLTIVILTSCQHRHATAGINYFIGPECHPQATLISCDTNSPPKCKKIVLKYDNHCEQVKLK